MMKKPSDHHKLDTLWRAYLSVSIPDMPRNKRSGDRSFYFREADEWEAAAGTAQRLLEESPACNMIGAVIVRVERIEHLWN